MLYRRKIDGEIASDTVMMKDVQRGTAAEDATSQSTKDCINKHVMPSMH